MGTWVDCMSVDQQLQMRSSKVLLEIVSLEKKYILFPTAVDKHLDHPPDKTGEDLMRTTVLTLIQKVMLPCSETLLRGKLFIIYRLYRCLLPLTCITALDAVANPRTLTSKITESSFPKPLTWECVHSVKEPVVGVLSSLNNAFYK